MGRVTPRLRARRPQQAPQPEIVGSKPGARTGAFRARDVACTNVQPRKPRGVERQSRLTMFVT